MNLRTLFLVLAGVMSAGEVSAQSALPLSQPETCATDTWAKLLSPGPQTPVPTQILETESGKTVIVFKFGLITDGDPMVGDFAKLYMFLPYDSETFECIKEAVVLGSYAYAQDEGPRRYTLHLYSGGSHATMQMFVGEPSLENISDAALAALD